MLDTLGLSFVEYQLILSLIPMDLGNIFLHLAEQIGSQKNVIISIMPLEMCIGSLLVSILAVLANSRKCFAERYIWSLFAAI